MMSFGMSQLHHGPIALYYQLQQQLSQRIRSGEFRPGDPVPTEEQLCTEYGVSRITVRRALDALLAQGLILRRRGIGTFVAEPHGPVKSVKLVGSLDEMLGAQEFSYKPLSRERLEPPQLVREVLELASGIPAVRVEVVNYSAGEPFGYSEIFFPDDVGALIHESDIAGGIPVLRVVEEKLNQRITRAEQTVEAALAGQTVADHLGIESSAPVLKVLRTYYVGANRPVEAVIARYHPERYRYTVQLVAGPP